MYLKLLIILVILNLSSYQRVFAQDNSKDYSLTFTKFLLKKYRTDEAIWKLCNANYAIVYFDVYKDKIVKVYAEDSLSNIIAKDLIFTLGYKFDFKEEKKTLALFFVIKNINADCVDTKNGYNQTSVIIENLLTKIYSKKDSVVFMGPPISLQTPITIH